MATAPMCLPLLAQTIQSRGMAAVGGTKESLGCTAAATPTGVLVSTAGGGAAARLPGFVHLWAADRAVCPNGGREEAGALVGTLVGMSGRKRRL